VSRRVGSEVGEVRRSEKREKRKHEEKENERSVFLGIKE